MTYTFTAAFALCSPLDDAGQIIQRALELDLDCIAITDHNSAGNAAVAMELAQRNGLILIPGMEVETKKRFICFVIFPL